MKDPQLKKEATERSHYRVGNADFLLGAWGGQRAKELRRAMLTTRGREYVGGLDWAGRTAVRAATLSHAPHTSNARTGQPLRLEKDIPQHRCVNFVNSIHAIRQSCAAVDSSGERRGAERSKYTRHTRRQQNTQKNRKRTEERGMVNRSCSLAIPRLFAVRSVFDRGRESGRKEPAERTQKIDVGERYK